MVVASSDGDIGYVLAGVFPKRNDLNLSARYVKRGDLKVNDWDGIVPDAQQPHLINPEKGYIVCANNKITTDNAITEIGVGMSGTTRADRIAQLIEEKIAAGHKFTIEDMVAIQYDKHDGVA